MDTELLALVEESQRYGLTQEQLSNLFSPLTPLLVQLRESRDETKGDSEKISETKNTSRRKGQGQGGFGLIAIGLLVICLAVVVLQPSILTSLRFHSLAVMRIMLVKALPFWNWTDLYYSRCLVRNPFFEDQELRQDDCNLCETLEDVERVSNVSQSIVIEEFIRRERPFIVTDAMNDWPIMRTNHFWFDNITEPFMDEPRYTVCNLNTNLRTPSGDLQRLLRKLYSPHTQQWFLHWENCQKYGAKVTRQFYRRPYFISNSLDFTGSNWVLMSSDFRGRVFKKIPVGDSLSMLYQLRGSNHIRLSPRETCRGHCPELGLSLYEGEILVVTNLLWMLEYIPGEVGDNLAILSEVSIPSLD